MKIITKRKLSNTKTAALLIAFTVFVSSCGRKAKDTENNNNEIVKEVIEDKSINPESIAKLKDAIESNDTSLVETSLLELDEVDYQLPNGETPLTFALKVAKRQIVAKLAHKSKNLNLKNKLGETPMIVAAKNERFYSMNILKIYGADINAVDNQANTPLIYVIKAKNETLAMNLIKNGADVEYVNPENLSILDLAKKNGLSSATELIGKILKLEETKINNNFIKAQINSAKMSFIEYLISNNQRFQKEVKKYNYLKDILFLKDKTRRMTVLKSVIDNNLYKGRVEFINQAVIESVKKEYNYELSLLLSKYEGVNIVDQMGRTPLTYAAELLNFNMVNLLVSHNANITYLYSSDLTEKKSVEVTACSFIPSKRASRRMSFVKRSRREELVRLLGCN